MSTNNKALPGEYDRERLLSALKWARSRGYVVVPVVYRAKAPLIEEWSAPSYEPPGDDYWLNDKPKNIGIITGPKRKGPVDIDHDWPEALFFGERFLPKTPAVFGRASKLRSHRLYEVSADGVAKFALTDPTLKGDGATIIELRGDGHQTVMPGSVHASGELIEWSDVPLPAPAQAEPEALTRAVKKVAFACLVVRHMWPEGPASRNSVSMHLGGMLWRFKWPLAEAEEFIRAIMEYRNDDDGTRIATLRDTYRKGEAGAKITGAKVLQELLQDDRVVDRITSWFGDKNAQLLERFNSEYCVVNEGGKVRVLRFTDGSPELISFDDFHNLHKHEHIIVDPEKGKAVGAGQWWTSHPQRLTYVGGLCFEPHKGEVVGDRLNLWRGWGVEPKPGDWSLMQDHLASVLSTSDDHGFHEEFYNYLYWWLAWTVQNPGSPAGAALVFRGREGSGRGTLGRAMCRIFGTHAQHLFSSEMLTGRFNYHLRNKCFVFADEAYWPGDKKAEGKLKGMLTEPTLPIEGKGLHIFNVPNVMHLMIATNDEWSAPAGPDARRFAAQHVSSRWMQNGEYFKKLWRQLDDGGLGAMLHDLLALDLEDWHPGHYGVPQTEELKFQKEQSDDTLAFRDVLQHYLQGACDREAYEGGIKVLTHEARQLVDVRNWDDRSSKRFGKAMRELGFRRDKQRGEWFYLRGEAPYRKVEVSWDNENRQWFTMLEGNQPANSMGGLAY
jgi:hypothetical protein